MASLNTMAAPYRAPAFMLAAAGLELMATSQAHASPSISASYHAPVQKSHIVRAAKSFATTTISISEQSALPTQRDIDQQIDRLLALPAGWDGYNAVPISHAVAAQIRGEIRPHCFGGVPAPDLIPGGDGSVQAEWYEVEIAMTYRVEPSGSAHTWVHDRITGHEFEAYGPEAIMLLAKWIPNLASAA